MARPKKEIPKHKPTAKDWAKIRALYLRGETLDYVMEQIPDVEIRRSTISERMSREGINKKKSGIETKVEPKYPSKADCQIVRPSFNPMGIAPFSSIRGKADINKVKILPFDIKRCKISTNLSAIHTSNNCFLFKINI